MQALPPRPPPAPPLVEIVGGSSKLVLDNVYQNRLHALRRIELRSVAPCAVSVRLRSNLGLQIAFQLSNENLPDKESHRRSNRNLGHPQSHHQPGNASTDANAAALTEPSTVAPGASLLSLESSSEAFSFSNESVQESAVVSPKPQSSSSSASPPLSATPPSSSTPPSAPNSPALTTNTVEAAAMGLMGFGHGGALAHGHQFNQLFNHVNHIDEVLLDPGQSQKIIIAFLPEPKSTRESVLAPQAPSATRIKSFIGARIDDDLFVAQGDEDETHDFIEVNGLIFFFVYKLNRGSDDLNKRQQSSLGLQTDASASTVDQQQQLVTQRKPRHVSTSAPNQSLARTSQSTGPDGLPLLTPVTELLSPPEGQTSEQSSQSDVFDERIDDTLATATTPADDPSSLLPVAAIPDYQLALKFRSRVCRSVLWTDIGATGIIFDDCVVGESYFKDFTIWNRSEIDLFWILNTVDLSSQRDKDWLQFSDYDTGEPLEPTLVPAYSYRRVRVTFRPRETGEFNYTLQIENQNDSANTIETRVHAVVRDVLREELLSVSCGNTLDFGDCCAGLWRKKRVTLRNMSDMLLDISFSTDYNEVVFQLKSDDGMPSLYSESRSQLQQQHHQQHQHHHHHLHSRHVSSHQQIHGPHRQHTQYQLRHQIQLKQQQHEQKLLRRDRLGEMQDTVPDMIGPDASERSVLERMQDVTATTVSATNSELSPTPSSTSSRASSPLLPHRKPHEGGTRSVFRAEGISTDGALIDGRDSIASGNAFDRTQVVTRIGTDEPNTMMISNTRQSGEDSATIGTIDMIRTSSTSSVARSDEIDNARLFELSHHDVYAALPDEDEYTRIEELQLRPGAERTIEICFRPERDPTTPDYRAGRLTKRNFRITLLYAHQGQQKREKSTIQAIARTCTSFIDVTPKHLHFGDTDVGTLKSLPIQITNCSDLPAHVDLRFISKVLNTYRGDMTIPARQHIEVKIDIYPRKVNPDYRKQITIVNLLNRDNDHVVEVCSTNIDKNRVTFHSLFYHVLTPASTNFIDFGSVVLNSPAVRSFTIENISQKRLVLEATSSIPDEIQILTRVAELSGRVDSSSVFGSGSAVERREKLLESLQESRKRKLTVPSSNAPSSSSNVVASSSSSSAAAIAGVTSTVTTTAASAAASATAQGANPGLMGVSNTAVTTAGMSTSTSSPLTTVATRLGKMPVGSVSGTTTGFSTVTALAASSLESSGHATNTATGSMPFAPGAVPSSSRLSRAAGDALTLADGETKASEYLDLASNHDGHGRRSPRRKGTQVQPAQMWLMRMQGHGRERKQSIEEDAGRPPLGSDHSLLRFGVHDDDMRDEGGRSSLVAMDGQDGADMASLRGTASASRRGPSGSDAATGQPHGSNTQLASPTDASTAQILGVLDGPRLTTDALITILEKNTGALPPLFPRTSLEEKYVKAQLLLRRELAASIQDGRLAPALKIQVEPGASFTVILVMTASGASKFNVQGKPRKHDARIFLRLCEFDRDIRQPQFEQLLRGDLSAIPVRELMLRSSLCRSIMELGQRNINFGIVDKNEQRAKSIVIRNNSEAPLMYTIRKSGSIASGDIALGEYRMGVVRGYGKREIEFVFNPSLAGPFHEKLVVENVQDRDNDQVMTVKASIKQPAHFFIEKMVLEFGVCMIGEAAPAPQDIYISNASQRHTRTFEVRVDPVELRFEGCAIEVSFELEHDDDDDHAAGIFVGGPGGGSGDGRTAAGGSLGSDGAAHRGGDGQRRVRRRPVMMMSQETEELIELVEQKLKIARRKGRKDKVKQLTDKLERLRSGDPADDYGTDREEPQPQLQAENPSPAPNDKHSLTVASTGLTSLVQEPTAESPIGATVPTSNQPGSVSAGQPSAPATRSSSSSPLRPSAIPLPGGSNSRALKRTPHSIVFSVTPRQIRAVRVALRVSRLPVPTESDATRTAPALATAPAINRVAIANHRTNSLGLASSSASHSVPVGYNENAPTTSMQSVVADSARDSDSVGVNQPGRSNHSEECTVRIYVHEQRNTDIVKRVLCKATVCYDHATYLQLLLERGDVQPVVSGGGVDGSTGCDVSRTSVTRDANSVVSRLDTDPVSVSDAPVSGTVVSGHESDRRAVLSMPITMSSVATTAAAAVVGAMQSVFAHVGGSVPVSSTLGDAVARQDMVGETELVGIDAKSTIPGSGNVAAIVTAAFPSAVTTVAAKSEVRLPPALVVEATFVDLGRLEIGERRDCYITLTNQESRPAVFRVATDPDLVPSPEDPVIVSPQSLAPGETRRVDIWVIPLTRGFQSRRFVIENAETLETCNVTFVFYGIYGSYLRFPSLVGPSGTPSNSIDLGDCYVDPARKYSAIMPLEIENVSGESVFVAATSNLAQQCLIFADAALERQLQDLSLAPGERHTVYVALQPMLGGPLAGTVSRRPDRGQSLGWSGVPAELVARVANQMDCRTLIGGIKFTVHVIDRVNNPLVVMATKSAPLVDGIMVVATPTLRFTATIGQSLFMISHGLINFGVSQINSTSFTSVVWIYNLSTRLPLEYEVRSSSPTLRFSKVLGRIEGVSASTPLGSTTSPPGPSSSLNQAQHSPSQSDLNSLASYPTTGEGAITGVLGRERLDFVLEPTRSGLISEFVEVRNLHNSLQQARVGVRLFIDPMMLSVHGVEWLPPPAPDRPDGLANSVSIATHPVLEQRPFIKWDNLYAVPASASSASTTNGNYSVTGAITGGIGGNTSATHSGASGAALSRSLILQRNHRIETPPVYERSFQIQNMASELVQLQPQSTMDVTVRWAISTASGFVVESPSGLRLDDHLGSTPAAQAAMELSDLAICGPTLLLHPGEKATAIVSAPRPRPILEDDVWDAVFAGQKVTQDGILLFQNLDRAMAVKLIELSGSYCLSTGEVRPTAFDLGRIGHHNMWKDAPFEFVVVNLSDTPMLYDIEVPDAIDIVSIEGESDVSAARRRIEPRRSHHVGAVLKPRKIEPSTPGPCAFSVGVTNMFNPTNNVKINVAAALTLFELRFDRLSSGQLVLPTLTHPTPPNALPCDNWFKVINLTAEDVRFEIGCTLAPDVAGLVGVEILSRFTNSPLSGSLSLGPKGSIEVKVRLSALALSRLAANESASKYLTNPDGITLGTLWVTSKSQAVDASPSAVMIDPNGMANATQPDASLRMTETIPIRGTIVEGATFLLSQHHIEFRSVSVSDSDEECETVTSNNVPAADGGDGVADRSATGAAMLGGDLVTSKPSQRPRPTIIQHEDIIVTNLSPDFQLEFKVLVEFPIDLATDGPSKLRIRGIDSSDMCGTVAPDGRLVLRVELLDIGIGGVSEDIRLHIYDKNSLGRQLQTIHISIVEDTTGVLDLHARMGDRLDEEEESRVVGKTGRGGTSNADGGGWHDDFNGDDGGSYVSSDREKLGTVNESDNTDSANAAKDGIEGRRHANPLGNQSATGQVNALPACLFEPLAPTSSSLLESPQHEPMQHSDSATSIHADEPRTPGPMKSTNTVVSAYNGSSNMRSHTAGEDEDVLASDGDRSTPSLGPGGAPSSSSRHLSMSESATSSNMRRAGGNMSLRGCKKVTDIISGDFEGLYELDLGQQDLGQTHVAKKIVIENASMARVSYRISTTTERDRAWMVCSRSDGVLEASRSAAAANGAATSHTITLSFIVSFRGAFSTYLLIENIDNRQDTKIVRVSIEVVAKQNVRRSAFSTSLALGSGNNSGGGIGASGGGGPNSASMLGMGGGGGGIGTGISSGPVAVMRSALPFDPTNNRAFDVFTHGMDLDDASIEIDPAYLGCVYSARSIVIINRELTPLEFSLKSNLSHEDESELVFSLSRTSAKLFRSIVIDPESSSRVFLRFWPGQSMPSTECLLQDDRTGSGHIASSSTSTTAAAAVNTGAVAGAGDDTSRELSGDHDGNTGNELSSSGGTRPSVVVCKPRLDQSGVEKKLEIYVNCRLVKDYQKIIGFRAVLRQPQIMLSASTFTFFGVIRRRQQQQQQLSRLASDGPDDVPTTSESQPSASIVQLAPAIDTFSITNLLQDVLEYEVVTDSIYFSLETVGMPYGASPGVASALGVDGGSARRLGPQPIPGSGRALWISTSVLSLEPMQTQVLRVIPLMDVITKNTETLKKEKYIIEHMVVYNKRRPSEKYVVHVKLSFGNVDYFHFASGSRRSFLNLESHIVRLMHELEAAPALHFDPRGSVVAGGGEAAIERTNSAHFLYLYIIDELVHYGTREQGAETFLQQATLLFTMLFSQTCFSNFAPALLTPVVGSSMMVWPSNLLRWVAPFVNLMGFFPHRLVAIEPLRQLARSLVANARDRPEAIH